MERLMKCALEIIAQLSDGKPVTLLSLEEKHKGIIVGGFVKGELIFPNKNINLKGNPVEKMISAKEAHTYPGMVVDSLPFPAPKDIKSGFSCLCLPLMNEKSQVKGIIVIAQKRGSPLAAERLNTLNTILPLIATVIDTSLEHERLIQLATRDNLTNLYSRPYFETRLQEEFTRVRRHGGVFSLLMMDIDRFKQINETCGYKEGNQVLKVVANLLNHSIRQEIDIPCRYAGKKFTTLLPNTSVDGAYILAERIRQRCEQHSFTTQQGIPLKVTLSAGIAHNVDIAHEDILEEQTTDKDDVEPTAISKEELMHRADTMLQAAKTAGRNQVMVWW